MTWSYGLEREEADWPWFRAIGSRKGSRRPTLIPGWSWSPLRRPVTRSWTPPLSKVGGKGLFVKEIEAALIQGEIHLAVHSMKDVPAILPGPLTLTAYPEREDPRDAMISIHYPSLDQLPEAGRVGTSSLRRSSQLLKKRPDLRVETLRGNVDTRLRKLDEGTYDAIVLAVAGLNRFGLRPPHYRGFRQRGCSLPWAKAPWGSR